MTLCTGSLGASPKNDMVEIIHAAGERIYFAHLRNVAINDRWFNETAHESAYGSLDMYEIVKALQEEGFDGYVRPDHGRMIWGEVARPGYGLFDRALGVSYLNGLWEAVEKIPQGVNREEVETMFNHENLKGRVAVVTGGGGVLCGGFAKTLAAQGCKVAVLDLNEAAAQAVADEINANGGQAIAVGCNVLEPASMRAARDVIAEKLGTCDILLNSVGGNNPKARTTKETLEKIDLAQQDPEVKTFFDLDPRASALYLI